jgi:hypothetical protein
MTVPAEAIDFQHRAERKQDPVVALLDQLDARSPGLFHLWRSLRATRKHLRLTKKEWRKLRSYLLVVQGFRILVEKPRRSQPTLVEMAMPKDVLDSVIAAVPEPSCEDGITYHAISFPRGSTVDRWVRHTYLSQARMRYRGITGYSAHVRYAYNSGAPQEWDELFVTPHAQFHWDQACNSFPFVVYLSHVGPSDGPFSVFADSLNLRPNPYLAAYDRYLTDRDGVDSHVSGDLVGRYLDEVPPSGVTEFTGPPGTGIMFEGRSIVHHGGYPNREGHRLVIFFNSKNSWMGLLDRFVRIG